MSKSKNWKATATPSMNGSKTTLKVTGDVPSGFIPPSLEKNETKEFLPANVFTLELKNEAPGATIQNVSFEQDITGQDQIQIVLIFNEGHEVIAAIIIDRVLS